jgi:hypothetical protein
MGFDPVRMFSVLASGGTYVWNGIAWEQVSAFQSCQSESMLFDSSLGDLVQPGYATLVWAPVGTRWSTVTLPGPPFQAHDVAVRQDAQQRFLLHTGFVFGSTITSQTWALDYGLTRFTMLATNGPLRDLHSMAYDTGRDQVILFGGITGGGAPCARAVVGSNYCDSTWLFDNSGWRQLSPNHSPPPRALASMIYDGVHNRIILFGGVADGAFLNDTWAWDGTDWTPIANRQPPAPRAGAPITYDPLRDQVVLFGGSDNTHNFADTWELGP